MSGLMLYFIIKLSAIQELFILTTIGCGLYFIAILMIWLLAADPPRKQDVIDKCQNLLRKPLPYVLGIVFLLLSMATPTTKQAIVLWALPKIVANEDIKEIPANFAKLINDKVKEWLEEVAPEKSIDKK